MKKLLRWASVAVLALLAAVVVLLIFKDGILKKIAEARVQSETGLKASIGEFHVSLRSGAVHLKDFKLLNTREFGDSPLLDMPEIYVLLDVRQAAGSKLHFKEVRFNLAQAHVVKNKSGKLNLEALGKRHKDSAGPKSKKQRRQMAFGGIDRLYLTLGSIKYTDLQDPAQNDERNLGIKNELVENVRSEEELEAQVLTVLFRAVIQEWMEHRHDSRGRGWGALLKLLTQ